jgi:hypothetical protein
MSCKYTAEELNFIETRNVSNILYFNRDVLRRFVDGSGFLTLTARQKRLLVEAGLVMQATRRRWKPTPELREALGLQSTELTKMYENVPHVGYSDMPREGHPVPVPSQGLCDKEEVGER